MEFNKREDNYGLKTIAILSNKLTEKYGRGFSKRALYRNTYIKKGLLKMCRTVKQDLLEDIIFEPICFMPCKRTDKVDERIIEAFE